MQKGMSALSPKSRHWLRVYEFTHEVICALPCGGLLAGSQFVWSPPRGLARHRAHCRRTPLPAPVQELLLEHGFIGLSETGFGRVRYQHVDASGTPIDNS